MKSRINKLFLIVAVSAVAFTLTKNIARAATNCVYAGQEYAPFSHTCQDGKDYQCGSNGTWIAGGPCK
jgi:hypothetical protein